MGGFYLVALDYSLKRVTHCVTLELMIVVRRLVWDAWNVPHIARHQVTPSEVEEVHKQKYLTRPSKKDRLAITGPTFAGRMLTIIIAPKEESGTFFTVTARPASQKERRLYQAFIQKGGGSK